MPPEAPAKAVPEHLPKQLILVLESVGVMVRPGLITTVVTVVQAAASVSVTE